jgi:hypothetical protein
MIKDFRPWLLCDFQLPYEFGDVPHGVHTSADTMKYEK